MPDPQQPCKHGDPSGWCQGCEEEAQTIIRGGWKSGIGTGDVTPAEATRLGDALGAAAEKFRLACEKVKSAQKAYDDAIAEHRRITGSNMIRVDQFSALQRQLDDAWRWRIDAYMVYTDARLDMLIRSSYAVGPAIAELRAETASLRASTAQIRRGDFGEP